ncbi:MAG: polymorphic toxin-type HINT domain-containing protein [Elusimicrobia bacterium]|nr:polymorphic toxin-type HINT domain-containing protein [Elusimicrobiota bacterium]
MDNPAFIFPPQPSALSLQPSKFLLRNLTLSAILASMAVSAWARGGGGCFEKGTPVLTPKGASAIETLRPGDRVLSSDGSKTTPSSVKAVYEVKPEKFIEVKTCGKTLRVTPQHPFMTAPGVFIEARTLKPGTPVYAMKEGRPQKCAVEAVREVSAGTAAYDLLVFPGGKYFAGSVLVHNKGCFLPDTRILKADGAETAVSEIKKGDKVLAFNENGAIVHAEVREIITADADEYFEITTPRVTVRATAEHPFYVGDGTFKTVEALKQGDKIFIYDGKGMSPSEIISIKRVRAKAKVYNLKTDSPNTFFANFAAVHNKGGGGGGCFPAGTLISAPEGSKPIEKLAKGDIVYAFDTAGFTQLFWDKKQPVVDETMSINAGMRTKSARLVKTAVKEVFAKDSEVLTLETGRGTLNTTLEHPLLARDGFKPAGELRPGSEIAVYSGAAVAWTKIKSAVISKKPEKVYNLAVEEPHTFIADGFIAHNKGFGGGYHSSGHYGGSSKDEDSTWMLMVGLGLLVIFIRKQTDDGNDEEENLDQLFPRAAIEPKAQKTAQLLEFISRQDKDMAQDLLKETARKTFEAMQLCWQNREYSPMQAMLTPNLYASHLTQIEIMRRDHEINVMDDLKVLAVDIVGVRYTIQEESRFFTALITAQARDYYIDDTDNSFIRGDSRPEQFQEFWTFHYLGGKWLLCVIEQTAESGELTREDFFEQFTDGMKAQVYGKTAANQGPAGPWLNPQAADKGVKIERMLNFLGASDKMWDPAKMEVEVSVAFLAIYAAWSKGDPEALPKEAIFPQMLESLKALMLKKKQEGMSFEFRNLCVRKVELVLVNNRADKEESEFVARISAHAQKRLLQNGAELHSDINVMPFTEYWTFGPHEGCWKLKEILSKAEGESALTGENKDEESSPMQLEWYYTKKRAY